MQSQGRLPVEERPFKSAIDCYAKTIQKEGFSALWNGWGANVARNSVINASKLASYD
jgi:hypothetical protein